MQHNFWHLLARTWAAVAFFHPFVQDRGQEWEEALLSVLPRAEVVADEPPVSANQRNVLELLLEALHDNATRLLNVEPERAKQPSTIARELLSDNIVYVQVSNWFDFHIAPGYLEEWATAMRSLNEAIEDAARVDAPALLLDFRETRGDVAEAGSEIHFVYERMRSELVSRLFNEPVHLPGTARIQRVGYCDPAESGAALGGYSTEWVMQAGNPVMPSVSAPFRGPVVVLTSRSTSSLLEPVLILLQRTGRAICVGEQSLSYHAEDQIIDLIDGINLQLRCSTLVYQGHPARYVPDVWTDDPLTTALALLKEPLDTRSRTGSPDQTGVPVKPYHEEFPSREQRILAVIKLWSAMRVFYAYREYLANWDAALVPALHEAAAATVELTQKNGSSATFVLAIRQHVTPADVIARNSPFQTYCVLYTSIS